MDQMGPNVEICLCPHCGSIIDDAVISCPSCNTDLVVGPINFDNSQLESLAIDSSLFICSNCGAFIGVEATNCGACGTKRTPLTAEIEISSADDVLSSVSSESSGSPEIFLCNNCGAFLSENASECEVCGMNLQNLDFGLEEEEEEEEYDLSDDDLAVDILHNEGALFLCNSCGAFIKPGAPDCAICGEEVSDIKNLINDEKQEAPTAEEKLSSPGVLYLCDKCGAFMREDASECPFCKNKKDEAAITEEKEIMPKELQTSKVSLEVPKFKRKSPSKQKRRPKKAKRILVKRVNREEVIEDCLRLWLKKAVALKKLGKPKEALQALNHALNLSSSDRVVMIEKADLYYETKNFVKAAQLYKQILNYEPENVSVWNKLGNALYRKGHEDESLLCYEKSLSLDSLNREAIINKGYILMRQEKWDEAIAIADNIAS